MKAGDKVILKNFSNGGFVPEMQEFVGSQTTLTSRAGSDAWYVANNEFFWTEEGLTLVTSKYKDQCPCGIHPSRCDYHKDV